MTNGTLRASDYIIQARRLRDRHRFLWFGRAKLKVPPVERNIELFLHTYSADGTVGLRRIVAEETKDEILAANDAILLSVNTARQPLEMAFTAAAEDKDSHAWDLILSGSWSVSDSRRFLTSVALTLVSPEAPLSRQVVESWIINKINTRARDEVRKAADNGNFEEVRRKDVLPFEWWDKQIANWLSDNGMSVKVLEARWQSADAAAAEGEQRRLESLSRIEQERTRQRQAELREMRANADYEKEKTRIDADTRLSAHEKEHKLHLLEKRCKRELIEAEAEVERATREAQKAALEHEVVMAELQNDLETIRQAPVREKEAEKRHGEVIALLAKAQETLDKLACLPKQMLGQLASSNTGYQAADRLVSPEFGFKPEELANLGYATVPQMLVQRIRDKASMDREMILLRKKELRTRSIDCVRVEHGKTRDIGTTKVKGLSTNSSLQLEFTTERPGFVTLINIGTSGSVYVHVPNAYVGRQEAEVVPARSYLIPGPELLPWEQLKQRNLDYVEVGPPGWEHIAVFVSDEPLTGLCTLYRATPLEPFVRFSDDELSNLCHLLDDMGPHTWSAAVISFLVE